MCASKYVDYIGTIIILPQYPHCKIFDFEISTTFEFESSFELSDIEHQLSRSFSTTSFSAAPPFSKAPDPNMETRPEVMEPEPELPQSGNFLQKIANFFGKAKKNSKSAKKAARGGANTKSSKKPNCSSSSSSNQRTNNASSGSGGSNRNNNASGGNGGGGGGGLDVSIAADPAPKVLELNMANGADLLHPWSRIAAGVKCEEYRLKKSLDNRFGGKWREASIIVLHHPAHGGTGCIPTPYMTFEFDHRILFTELESADEVQGCDHEFAKAKLKEGNLIALHLGAVPKLKKKITKNTFASRSR